MPQLHEPEEGDKPEPHCAPQCGLEKNAGHTQRGRSACVSFGAESKGNWIWLQQVRDEELTREALRAAACVTRQRPQVRRNMSIRHHKHHSAVGIG
eukprot:g31941.t1